MKPFYSIFSKKNRAALFFCLVEEPYECKGGERSHPVVFCETIVFLLFIVIFYIHIQKPFRSYFIGNQTPKQWNRATIFSLTHQPNKL
jgi:hypothetical protein